MFYECFTIVSIPYGTIKRPCASVSVICIFVSIPYGTIKSVIALNFSIPTRVSIPYGTIKRPIEVITLIIINVVSIPYGTIKSYESALGSQSGIAFQFLMVRLKVFVANIN